MIDYREINCDDTDIEFASCVFTLLGDPLRTRIVLALYGVELTIDDLTEILNTPAEQVRDELDLLESVDVVAHDLEEGTTFYLLSSNHAGALARNSVLYIQERIDESDLVGLSQGNTTACRSATHVHDERMKKQWHDSGS